MKTRNGFISNSSSTSFVVFHSKISFGEIEKKDVEKGNIYCYGSEHGEGYDFFEVTSEIYELLKRVNGIPDAYKAMDSLRFYNVYHLINAESSNIHTKESFEKILKQMPPKTKFAIDTIDISYHTCEDAKAVRDSYFSDITLEGEVEAQEAAAKMVVELEEKSLLAEKQREEIEGELKEWRKKTTSEAIKKVREEK